MNFETLLPYTWKMNIDKTIETKIKGHLMIISVQLPWSNLQAFALLDRNIIQLTAIYRIFVPTIIYIYIYRNLRIRVGCSCLKNLWIYVIYARIIRFEVIFFEFVRIHLQYNRLICSRCTIEKVYLHMYRFV